MIDVDGAMALTVIDIQSESKDGKIRFTAWVQNRVIGSAVIEVLPLVCDMEIEDSLITRKIADALFQYMSGYVKASGFSEAAVLVAPDNEKMRRYVEQRATPEEPARMYLMAVK